MNNILKILKKTRRTRIFLGTPAFVVFLLVLTIILSSCDGSYMPRPKDVNYFEGTKGLESAFLEEAPPDEIYENSTFNINLFLENRGAFDVVDENYGIISISFDPFYVDVSDLTELRNADSIDVSKNGIVVKGIQLYGKSKYFPTGSETFLSFPNFKTKGIKGQREQPRTQIFSSLCYPYVTTLSDLVCIDLNIYGQNLRKQVCSQQDLSFADQGAPLAVMRVEVENQPAGSDVVRPVFTIHVRNRGSGSVLSSTYNAADFERVCSFNDLYREDFNTVNIRAILSNTKELVCFPNPIRLFDGEGFTRCKVRDEDLIIGHQNYETPLTVNLSYIYLTSISREIEIKRLSIYGGSSVPSDACLPYQIQVGGGCEIKCNYCATHPGAGECQPVSDPQRPGHQILFQKGFACQCSLKECGSLYPNGLCVPQSGFCPGASYCCLPKCKSSEVRLDDGKCYSKCSTSTCSEARQDDCACGSGTESTGYKKVAKGRYCCPKDKGGYADKTSCDNACAAVSA